MFEHFKIVRWVFREAESGIEPDLMGGHPGLLCHRETQPQVEQQVGPEIDVIPVGSVMHQNDRTAQRRHGLSHWRARPVDRRFSPMRSRGNAPPLFGGISQCSIVRNAFRS